MSDNRYDLGNPPLLAATSDNLARKTAKRDGGKKKMDPNVPKRGLSAYMFFANETRGRVREDNPGITFGDVGKVVGEKWKSLNEKQKAPFEAMAAAEQKRYEEEKATYHAVSSTYNLETEESPKHKSLDTDSTCRLFKSSLRSYGTLLLALQRETLRSTHLTTSLVPELKDEFSRLRIWGEQTYAVLPRNARRSLDEQLREDEDTKQIVIRSLQRLNNHIRKGWATTQDIAQLPD
ncbi:hypothetical protein E4T52_08029 [Aureobasidium sp. EXF-3400]|nr:hypothetical protein E4T51_03670 [Aureobasidium sp. EXF-12344]KAI4777009.1 hypothetical protein E4T52_08029 [Aureobasidium sp. EXF-3400]